MPFFVLVIKLGHGKGLVTLFLFPEMFLQ